MSRRFGLAGLLLLSSSLVAPSAARAQAAATPPTTQDPAPTAAADPAAEPPQEAVDVSVPGATNEPTTDIVVTGRRTPNIIETAPQVVSILSSADIARTGEGNIAGALGRVTGLSVVGNGFVYVRGLGDRYSLALLNGSPLPSPEPLRRTVPLDLFPTGVIASSLVQKTYSVNFPGEFGGGVINLTTKAVPKESSLTIGGSIGGDSETTGRLGYTYFGSASDWTGFDNGGRNTPPALYAYLNSGNRLSASSAAYSQAIAAQLITPRFALLQRNTQIPANAAFSANAGYTRDIGSATLGVIAAIGYSSKWKTRDTRQQVAASANLGELASDFERVITDNRVVVNGLLGYGLEFGSNKLRWTNLYIRDTLKTGRLGRGQRPNKSTTVVIQDQKTGWYERQLIDTQLVGEFKFGDQWRLDVRGGYADSRREAPNEFTFEYQQSNDPNDPYGPYFINRLNNGNRGDAEASYSFLRETLWSGGIDLSYKPTPKITATLGYAYSDTKRRTERRDFQFSAGSSLPLGVSLLRPDLLLQSTNLDPRSGFGITLIDTNEANPVFRAKLRNHAGYAQLQAELSSTLSLNTGVRFEQATQTVDPVQVFTVPTASLAGTRLSRNYWLPAATLTWEVANKMQLRFNASKTIARPQFRELIFQSYFDPDTNREYRGNPLLIDSQLYNAEARFEWYFARDQRLSVAGFFKKIDKPIEAFVSFKSENDTITSYANAPSATLYGGEIEVQKYFNLSGLGSSSFWESRRAVVVANYTYTKSKIKVGASDSAAVFQSAANKATDFFTDGSALTGQSDHLTNLQFGLEDTDSLSAQTFLLSYASDRVTSRGAPRQPDVIERPGFQLDFVARQGIKIVGKEIELKLEVRNITGTSYQEFQQSGANRVYFNRYRVGTSATFGANITF